MANECNPGIVSPPVAATWIVLISQSHPSGLPCGPGAVIVVRLQGGDVSFWLNPSQSPAKTILSNGPSTSISCHRGSIIWAFHCAYNAFREVTSPGRLLAKFWLSLISVAKL